MHTANTWYNVKCELNKLPGRAKALLCLLRWYSKVKDCNFDLGFYLLPKLSWSHAKTQPLTLYFHKVDQIARAFIRVVAARWTHLEQIALCWQRNRKLPLLPESLKYRPAVQCQVAKNAFYWKCTLRVCYRSGRAFVTRVVGERDKLVELKMRFCPIWGKLAAAKFLFC